MIAVFFINNIPWQEVDVDERKITFYFPFLPKLRAIPWDINVSPAESVQMKEMIFERNGRHGDKLRYDLTDITSTEQIKLHLLITGGRQ